MPSDKAYLPPSLPPLPPSPEIDYAARKVHCDLSRDITLTRPGSARLLGLLQAAPGWPSFALPPELTNGLSSSRVLNEDVVMPGLLLLKAREYVNRLFSRLFAWLTKESPVTAVPFCIMVMIMRSR